MIVELTFEQKRCRSITRRLDGLVDQEKNLPSNEESTHQSVSNQQLPGLMFQEIPKDGHCLYHAVGVYVGQGQDHLRKLVADYISCNLDSLVDFLDLTPNQSVEDYLRGVCLGKEWATHVEIEILMRLLRRPILVTDSACQVVNIADAGRFEGDPIFVAYNEHNHYNAWLLNGELSPREILSEIERSSTMMQLNAPSPSHFDPVDDEAKACGFEVITNPSQGQTSPGLFSRSSSTMSFQEVSDADGDGFEVIENSQITAANCSM